MLERLESLIDIEQLRERLRRHLHGEHDRVNRQAGTRHPEDEHHHWQVAQRLFCCLPSSLLSNKKSTIK